MWLLSLQVVLVLGEIDCREGLLLAVQKGKVRVGVWSAPREASS